MALESCIPRSDKDFIDRPLNMLYFGLSPVDNLKFSGSPVLLVYYDPGNIFPFASSHI